jgi:hypothetical protein
MMVTEGGDPALMHTVPVRAQIFSKDPVTGRFFPVAQVELG